MGSSDDDPTATMYVDDEEDVDDEEHQYDVDVIGDEEDVDDDEEEEDDSTSSAAGDFTIAVAGTPTVTTVVTPTTTTTTGTATMTTTSVVRPDAAIEPKKPALDDSRRLFQRLWTDEDEIELLQGFLDYTIQRGTNNSSHAHHHDTTAYYDHIKGKLQLDFNKNQLVEKIRRLKKKYRNVLSKISSGKEYVFKSPHDQATFDLSCKIWGHTPVTTVSIPAADSEGNDYEEQNLNPTFNLNNHDGNEIADPNYSEKKVPKSRKRSRPNEVKSEDNCNQQQQYSKNSTSVTPNLVEETVKSSLLPLFKELVNNLANGNCGNSSGLGLGLGSMSMMNPFGGSMNFQIGDMSDEKWRKQEILELEVYSKRLELMQDQVKSRLEELRSLGN